MSIACGYGVLSGGLALEVGIWGMWVSGISVCDGLSGNWVMWGFRVLRRVED